MTNSELNAVNFDLVKDKYIEDLSVPEKPKSSDAFYASNSGEMYLIEFKNGSISRKVKSDARLKIVESLLILTDILGVNLSYTRQNLSFILVYNENKNPLEEDAKDELQISKSRDYIDKRVS